MLKYHTINLFLIRLIATIQKIAVAAKIHARCSRIVNENAGSVNIRMMATRWVSGRMANAKYWRLTGSRVSGKNVPEKSAIGVMNRNEG